MFEVHIVTKFFLTFCIVCFRVGMQMQLVPPMRASTIDPDVSDYNYDAKESQPFQE